MALQAYPIAPVVPPPGSQSPRGSPRTLTPRGNGSRRGSGNSTNPSPPSSSSLRRVLPRPVGAFPAGGRNYAAVADTPGATMDEEDMDFDEYNDYHMPSHSRDRELSDASIPPPPSSSSVHLEELGQVIGIYPLHSSIDPLCVQLQPPPSTLSTDWGCGLLEHVMEVPSYQQPVTEGGYHFTEQVCACRVELVTIVLTFSPLSHLSTTITPLLAHPLFHLPTPLPPSPTLLP